MNKASGLILLLILLSWTLTSHAGTPALAPFLNYREFKVLASKDRVAYLESIRKMAVDAERAGGAMTAGAAQSPADLWALVFMARAEAARGDTCIYAGYISQRGAGNACERPASASGSCASGQTQCNPLLYGYGPGSSSGICTSERSYPTRDCERQYQSLSNYKASDVANQLVSRNMQREFDAQAARLSQYCASPASGEQRNMCRTLSAKTSYMRAKVTAAEQRQNPRQPAQTRRDETPSPATRPEAPASAPAAPPATAPAPARASDTAPASAGGTRSVEPAAPAAAPPAAAPAPAPVAQARPNPPAPQRDAPAAEAPRRQRPADGCMKDAEDYATMERELPSVFRGLNGAQAQGVHLAGKTDFFFGAASVNVSFRFRLVNGKFKLLSHIVPSMQRAPFVTDDPVTKVCVLPNRSVMIHLANGSKNEITVNGEQIVVKNMENPDYPMNTAAMDQAAWVTYTNNRLVPSIRGARPVQAQR